ncbi:MAG: DASS family sodium-coupled anion symporter [Saprospiraceae bacterium]|nr:DASS family sodium-coupled anion symporter [Saprospiraceae bacterium]
MFEIRSLKISLAVKNVFLLISALVIALVFCYINPFSLDEKASLVLSIATLMIFLWVTEAIPMPIVAILPLILFPLLKISTLEETSRSYANPVIFLFFGGFILGLAIEKWNLHKRIALNIIKKTGTGGDKIVLGFILATGLLSMWLSNTATTMMMYPIALSVIAVISQNQQQNANYAYFNLTIMLSIAYASNIGGIATIIGTPPNVAFIGYFQNKYGMDVDFMRWMMLCTPISILLLIALYLVMVKWLYPSHIKSDQVSENLMNLKVKELGPMTLPEKRVLLVFLCTAGLWVFRSLINSVQSAVKLDDTIIAVIAAVVLFIIPSGDKNTGENETAILEWSDTGRMAWGILLLFGGGICLAETLENAGLIQILGVWLSGNTTNIFILIAMITILSIFISEVMSNVAQVIVFAPVVSSMADSMNINPLLLGIPMTLAASCAGMLPMGTPPNAIVFASNHIKMKDMIKVGFIMNLIAIGLITLFTWYLVPIIF